MGAPPYIAGETIDSDDSGVIQLGIQSSDNTLQIIPAEPGNAPPSLKHLQLTQSQIDGLQTFYVLGHNLAIDNANLQDLTTFGEDFITQPTTLTTMGVQSDSVEDDSAGTGARKVQIAGLDANWAVKTQTVTLNGTTEVLLDDSAAAIEFLKVTQMHVIDPAPTNAQHTAVGTITLEAAGGGIVYGNIEAGGNMELACRGTVPDGFTGYVTGWNASAGKVPAQGDEIAFLLRGTVNPTDRTLMTNVFIFQDVMHLAANANYSFLDPPLEFPSRCEIKVSAQLNGNSTAIGSASLQGWLVPDA